jgi:hypothetical protein
MAVYVALVHFIDEPGRFPFILIISPVLVYIPRLTDRM